MVLFILLHDYFKEHALCMYYFYVLNSIKEKEKMSPHWVLWQISCILIATLFKAEAYFTFNDKSSFSWDRKRKELGKANCQGMVLRLRNAIKGLGQAKSSEQNATSRVTQFSLYHKLIQIFCPFHIFLLWSFL